MLVRGGSGVDDVVAALDSVPLLQTDSASILVEELRNKSERTDPMDDHTSKGSVLDERTPLWLLKDVLWNTVLILQVRLSLFFWSWTQWFDLTVPLARRNTWTII